LSGADNTDAAVSMICGISGHGARPKITVRHFHNGKQALAGPIGLRLTQLRRNNQSLPLIQYIIKYYRLRDSDGVAPSGNPNRSHDIGYS
jgi:hypothetical protein